MAEPTEADRERAVRLWQDLDNAGGSLIPAVAQALADERERARAPFLALAEELQRGWWGSGAAFRDAADRIRRAAQETGQ